MRAPNLNHAFALACLVAAPTYDRAYAEDESCSAVVGPEQALFTFPIEHQGTWRWNLSSTSADQKEFFWQVAFQNEGRVFHAGYYYWINKNKAEQSGTLSQLIRSGMIGIDSKGWSGGGGGMGGVYVEPAGSKMLIVITGQDNIQAYFSSRPQNVTIEIQEPGKGLVQKIVPVTYTN